jgi:hypothetical protein
MTSRRTPFRAPEPPAERRDRRVVRAADPPVDPAVDQKRARAEAARLVAAQMAENAREERRASRRVRAVGWIFDALATWFLR